MAATATATATATASRRQIPRWVEGLVAATDTKFRVPGTSHRFGYDALIGLIPGIGDVVGMFIGMAVIYAALQTEVSKRVIARMLGNIALDAFVGSIPVVGDLFDFVFKANKRNLQILQRELDKKAA